MRRREFIGGLAAAAVMPGFAAGGTERIRRVADAAEIGKPLPAWKPGELELHFIATGVGENAFYRLPDGTTWLNDCGDYWYDKAAVPPMPSNERLGAEWVVRYIERLGVKGPIDYLTISHWHTDHVGDPKMRSVVTKDGRKVCGAALVAERLGVVRYSDFEHPEMNKYKSGDHSRLMMREYVELAVKERGLKAEAFRVGALDQFRLLHDPDGKYAKLFHVRNLCANGCAWTGRGEESRDFAGEQVELTKKPFIDANSVSMAVRIDYGPFRFYTGGDVGHAYRTKDGRVDYEAHVARVAGPVTVAKTNHHGTPDTMGKAVVGELRAAAWVSCVWHKAQINDTNMRWMSSRELYPGDRFLFPTWIPQPSVEAAKGCAWWKDVVSPGHIVVKVAPGGETYRIYVLGCRDESMRVESVFAGTVRAG